MAFYLSKSINTQQPQQQRGPGMCWEFGKCVDFWLEESRARHLPAAILCVAKGKRSKAKTCSIEISMKCIFHDEVLGDKTCRLQRLWLPIMPSPTCKQIMPIVGEKVFGNYTRHLGALWLRNGLGRGEYWVHICRGIIMQSVRGSGLSMGDC